MDSIKGNKNSAILRIIVYIFLGLIFLLLISTCSSKTNIENKKVEIIYYYENICESCDIDKEFRNYLNNNLPENHDKSAYSIQTINIIKKNDIYEHQLSKLGIDETKVKLPMLVLGNSLLLGDKEIDRRLEAVFQREVLRNNNVITYFYRDDCPSCIEIEGFVESLRLEFPFPWDMINTSNSFERQKFLKKLEENSIEEEKRVVPFIIIDNHILSGSKAIKEHVKYLLIELENNTKK